jgi:hypothetical protein
LGHHQECGNEGSPEAEGKDQGFQALDIPVDLDPIQELHPAAGPLAQEIDQPRHDRRHKAEDEDNDVGFFQGAFVIEVVPYQGPTSMTMGSFRENQSGKRFRAFSSDCRLRSWLRSKSARYSSMKRPLISADLSACCW